MSELVGRDAGSTPRISTGVEQLDRMLHGGYPKQRPILVEGEPGAGKSTLAMQFLQEGLENGEECLFVSTEQTREELEDSFGPFPYDLDHERLTVSSLHVQTGRADEDLYGTTVEKNYGKEESGFVLRTLEGGQFVDEHQVSFTGSNVRQYLSRIDSCDRVVLDSVSGLSTMATDFEAFRRATLDLIRLFSDTFGATSVLTTEAGVPGDDRSLLRYNTHGAIRLTRESVAGRTIRFLRVEKMRGIDHDTRRYKLRIDAETGVSLHPRRRSRTEALNPHGVQPTGVPGLDDLLGGGLGMAVPTFIEHDGLADVEMLIAAMLNRAVAEGFDIAVLASPEWTCDVLDTFLWVDETVDSLMADDRLFVVCGSPREKMASANVFHLSETVTATDYYEMLAEIADRSQHPVWTIVDLEAQLDFFDAADIRSVWRNSVSGVVDKSDTIVVLSNRNVDTGGMAEFVDDISPQKLSLTMDEDGLTYARLEQSKTGSPGAVRVADYTDEPPYVAFH